jgi:DNA-binding NarL/FixJ family response regulator
VGTIDVVLADNHPLTLSGLRSAVTDHSDIQILDECTDRERLLDTVRSHLPHVLLVSAELLQENMEAVQALASENQETRVILLASRKDTAFLQEALRNGARGVVLRENPVHHIPAAIRKVTRGELWFDRDATARILNSILHNQDKKKEDLEDQKIATISPREKEVIGLICEGLRNKEISDRLNISEATVSHHLTSIFRKLDIEDRVSLVIYAVKRSLVTL